MPLVERFRCIFGPSPRQSAIDSHALSSYLASGLVPHDFKPQLWAVYQVNLQERINRFFERHGARP